MDKKKVQSEVTKYLGKHDVQISITNQKDISAARVSVKHNDPMPFLTAALRQSSNSTPFSFPGAKPRYFCLLESHWKLLTNEDTFTEVP
jgi:hypothetical protein